MLTVTQLAANKKPSPLAMVGLPGPDGIRSDRTSESVLDVCP